MGKYFSVDADKVHILITKFIYGNDETEAKIQVLVLQADWRQYFIALWDHYKGVGVNSIGVTKAESIITDLFIMDTRNPTFGGTSLKNNLWMHSMQ